MDYVEQTNLFIPSIVLAHMEGIDPYVLSDIHKVLCGIADILNEIKGNLDELSEIKDALENIEEDLDELSEIKEELHQIHEELETLEEIKEELDNQGRGRK